MLASETLFSFFPLFWAGFCWNDVCRVPTAVRSSSHPFLLIHHSPFVVGGVFHSPGCLARLLLSTPLACLSPLIGRKSAGQIPTDDGVLVLDPSNIADAIAQVSSSTTLCPVVHY